MRPNNFILLTILSLAMWTSCQQSDAGSGNDSEEDQQTEASMEFLENSVAKGLMVALEKEQPYDTEIMFSYASFEPGAMVIEGNEEGLREIDELASVMNANPKLNIVVHAFVDPSNSGGEDPKRVARMRTFFIKSRLIDNGIPAQMIETAGTAVDSPEETRLMVRVLGE